MTTLVGDVAQRHGSPDAAVVSLCLWLAGLLDGLVGDLVSESKGTTLLVDGSLTPCWSWKDAPELYSGKHKTTGTTSR